MMYAEELYSCKDHGFPILHDTSLELMIVQKKEAGLVSDSQSGLVFPSDICLDSFTQSSASSFLVSVKVQKKNGTYNRDNPF